MERIDLSDTITAKSDQLGADDLLGGPITVQITGVSKVGGDQPVEVAISGGHRPWKPCKTMRRLCVHAWGSDGAGWIGKWVTLYRDDTVRFGGSDVGGIRVSAMSGIDRAIRVALAATKGKKAEHRVAVLQPPTDGMSLADFRAAIGAAMKRGWSKEQIAQALGVERADLVPACDRHAIAADLSAPPPAPDEDAFDAGAEE